MIEIEFQISKTHHMSSEVVRVWNLILIFTYGMLRR